MMDVVRLTSSGGAGDVLCALWVAAGYRAAGREVAFYYTNAAGAAICATFWPSAKPAAVAPTRPLDLFTAEGGWHADLERTRGRWRVDVWADKATSVWGPVSPQPPAVAVPLPEVPPALTGNVLAWPLSAHRQRMASPPFWARVARLVERSGRKLIVCGLPSYEREASNYGLPFHAVDSWPAAAAAMLAAGRNAWIDSAPLHVGGAVGAGGIALLAQHSMVAIVGGYGSIIGRLASRAPCVPCHFQPAAGYRPPECRGGCSEMLAASPGEMAEALLAGCRP